MLSRIGLQGFKAYANPTELHLRPLTILCGTNGCGKSTLLQAVLMLKQATEGPRSSRVILLNGDLVRLGGPVDVLANRDASASASVSVQFDVDFDSDIEIEHRFVRNAILGALSGTSMANHSHEEHRLSCELTFGSEEHGLGVRAEVRRIAVELIADGQQLFSGAIESHGRLNEDTRECSVSIKAPAFEEMRDEDTFDADVAMYGPSIEWVFFGSGDRRKAIFGPYGTVADQWVRDDLQRHSSSDHLLERARAVEVFVGLLDAVSAGLRDGVGYLGPLRQAPRRDYEVFHDAVDVGPRGENAAQVYVSERESELPEVRALGESHYTEQETWSLEEGMKYWFEAMDLGSIEPYETEYSTSVLLSGARRGPASHSLADTGFGYSQVFPILLQGLRLPMDGTLLLEQPEIHLHPRMQMQVADYLMALATFTRNVMVETHSDHVVNRVVRRVVEGKMPPDSVGIYFVSSGPEGPVIEEVEIDPLYGIRKWPLGFFDQFADEQEAIIRAGLIRRSEEGRN